MSAILRFCNHYCTCLVFLALVFYGLLFILEKQRNEYLIKEIQHGGSEVSRMRTIGVVLIINAVLFIACMLLVKAQPKQEEPEEEGEWKFAYKLEKP